MSTAGACVSKCTQVHEYYSSQSPKTRSLSTDRCLCSSASHMPPKRKGRAQPRLDVPKYKEAASAADESSRHAGQVPRVRFWEGRKFTTEDGLLNEFAMMWALRNKFPLHYVLFKQTACHLPREANVEQIFSRAGLLADPNLNPAHLAVLVRIGFNKKAFEPAVAAIKEKYYELFRGKGGEHKEGSSGAAGAASPSAAGAAGAASSSDAADVAS